MSNPSGRQPKRLLTGSRVCWAFGDFYDNPDPNIWRRKRLRIHGTITGACGERKYTVQFDSGQIIECFSNTLRLQRPTASLPPVEIQAAVSEVEAEGNHAEEAAHIIEDNEAAANDAEVEDHLPGGTP
jgi:hypothetical protein